MLLIKYRLPLSTELDNDTVILSLGDPGSGSSRRLVSVVIYPSPPPHRVG